VTGRGTIKPDWKGPGDTVSFYMSVDLHGADPRVVEATVASNVNHPEAPKDPASWEQDYPMQHVGIVDGHAVYRADLPVYLVGRYQAIGRVRIGPEAPWKYAPGGNVEFRPRDVRADGITWDIVCLKNLPQEKTLRAMMDESHPYSIKREVADKGVTGIRLQPILEHINWSPYSANHSLAIGARYSRDAQPFVRALEALEHSGVDTHSEEYKQQTFELMSQAHEASMRELFEFVRYCKSVGIFVCLDIVPNHADGELQMEDVFFAPASRIMARAHELARGEAPTQKHVDQAFAELPPDPNNEGLKALYSSAVKDGERIIAQVRRRDPTQAVVNPAALEWTRAYLAQNRGEVAKWIDLGQASGTFGTWGSSLGAADRSQCADGGWFEWVDATQLNTGTARYGYSWFDAWPVADSEWEQAFDAFKDRSMASPQVNAEIARQLRTALFFLTIAEFDSLRIDHATGDPNFVERLDEALGLAQLVRPGVVLPLFAEDFHTSHLTERYVDNIEGGEHHALRGASGPEEIRGAIDLGWRRKRSTLNLGNHDESPPVWSFSSPDDYAYRQAELIALGPWSNVMGHRRGEGRDGLFRTDESVPTYDGHADATAYRIEGWLSAALHAKNAVPCFQSADPLWMPLVDGSYHGDIQAAYRFDLHGKTQGFYFGNCNGAGGQSGVFSLPPQAAALIDRSKTYALVNRWGGGEEQVNRLTGAQLLDEGVGVVLGPRQQQMLELVEEGADPWQNEFMRPRPDAGGGRVLYSGPGSDAVVEW
jgi:hypothetical protein